MAGAGFRFTPTRELAWQREASNSNICLNEIISANLLLESRDEDMPRVWIEVVLMGSIDSTMYSATNAQLH